MGDESPLEKIQIGISVKPAEETAPEKSEIGTRLTPKSEERQKAISDTGCVIPSFTEEEELQREKDLYEEKRQKYIIDAVSEKWEKELLLALAQEEQQEKSKKSAPFDAGFEDWEKLYSYEEKRLKSLLHGEGWETKSQLWEVQNRLIPLLEDWEKQYSCEEKRLKALVDREGYDDWEIKNQLWEIENHLVPILEQWEIAAPFPVGFEDWEKVFSYEEKRLKSLVDGEGYEKWEKDNQLWEIENHLIPIAVVEQWEIAAPFPVGSEDWEKVYSFEEKRLKLLVDGEGYHKWEIKNRLWEIENCLVSYKQKYFFDVVSGKWEKEFRLAPEEEEQRPKKLYKEKRKRSEPFNAGSENWEKVYLYEEKRLRSLVDEDGYEKWEKENWLWEVENGLVPSAEEWENEYLYEEEKKERDAFYERLEERQPAEGCSTVISREEKREKLAAEGRCIDESYLTPYCKCNRKYYQFDTALEGHPPECIPIWLAYCR